MGSKVDTISDFREMEAYARKLERVVIEIANLIDNDEEADPGDEFWKGID